ncbi:hypothetical protein [Nannocystis radixulma]|uniref:Uncharacterized protein n=1 Tax=Nannocystis radixulma TaxID=2995305 RepID=A0ABT5BGV2_9BACT|nr:hypothetical protein [Nannocystis radixulma]MDC0672933.1 hypothetical protein [Nannocystis radixulma]
MRSSVAFVLSFLALDLACKDDSDPLASAGPTSIGPSSNPGGSGDEPPDDEPTTGGTSMGGSTGSETGGMSGTPRDWCQRYLECLAVTDPNALPDAQDGFGPDSDCWTGSAADAELCLTACITGIEQYQPLAPDEPACFRCNDTGECDPADEADCVDHRCVPRCGNGVIDEGEVCDLSFVCDECKTDAFCSPLNDAGCVDGEKCILPDNGDITSCVPESDADPGVGGSCDSFASCGQNLYCVFQSYIPESTCDGCCAPFCDVNAEDPCPEGFCYLIPFNGIPPLDYLGVCLL